MARATASAAASVNAFNATGSSGINVAGEVIEPPFGIIVVPFGRLRGRGWLRRVLGEFCRHAQRNILLLHPRFITAFDRRKLKVLPRHVAVEDARLDASGP